MTPGEAAVAQRGAERAERATRATDPGSGPASRQLAIEVNDLTVAYREQPVLWDVDLTVPAGVLMAIVGPNGAGKTTLISILTTTLRADRGRVRVAGHDVLELAHGGEGCGPVQIPGPAGGVEEDVALERVQRLRDRCSFGLIGRPVDFHADALVDGGDVGGVEHEAVAAVAADVGGERDDVAVVLGGRPEPGRERRLAAEHAFAERVVLLAPGLQLFGGCALLLVDRLELLIHRLQLGNRAVVGLTGRFQQITCPAELLLQIRLGVCRAVVAMRQ
mgnify:CR=1 FL=1